MTGSTAPVGWPFAVSAAREDAPLPEPTGWPSIPSAPDGDDDVSRETSTLLRDDRPDAVGSEESTGDSRPDVEAGQATAPTSVGYDILLGGAVQAREGADGSAQGYAPEDVYIPRHARPEDRDAALEQQRSLAQQPAASSDADGHGEVRSLRALVTEIALPFRRGRRSGRPRVPRFEQVDQEPQTVVSTTPVAAAAPLVSTPTQPAQPPGVEVESAGGLVDTDGPVTPRDRPVFTAPERLPKPAHPRILTVANQKGGVGKTTTTVNVAAALAQSGLKVLVIDVDPQGNASTALGIDHHADVDSMYDVIVDGVPLADVIKQCPDVPDLWCAPATVDLAGAEIELVSLVARESRLHRAIHTQLEAMPEQERFDYVFIDCPPSLGLLTVNAFVAADEVFIPIQCEYYALEGLSQLLKNIEMIKMHLNPGLHVSTILLTMYDGRTKLSEQVADEVRSHFPDQVLKAAVPRSVRISEAPSHGETVMTYDPASTGAMSYRDSAREIALRGAAPSAQVNETPAGDTTPDNPTA